MFVEQVEDWQLFLSAAINYASKGWHILPVELGGKRPLIRDWPHQATTDPDQLRWWWRQWPRANIGVACGQQSGLFVLDVDAQHGGQESLAKLVAQYGPLPDTPTVQTGSGGWHVYLRYPAGVTVRNSAGKLGAGLDVRGEGGFVVAPPSIHSNGNLYRWAPGCSWDVSLAEAPQWLIDLLVTRPGPTGNGQQQEGGNGKIPSGQRNSTLTSRAGQLRRMGWDEAAILRALLAENQAVCDPPLAEAEVAQIAASVCRYEPGYAFTDLGNAERFAAAHRGKLFYNFDLHAWGAWTGQVWRLGAEAEVLRAAEETVRLIHLEAANSADQQRRKELARWALQCENKQRIQNLIFLARHRLEVEISVLDTHPDLLTCENGVIDLRTGALKPHDPDLLLTKKIEARYDPEAQCPAWMDFLRLVTCDDPELMCFLQVAVGYTLTGRTDEQCFFLLYGPSKNGKTTFIEALHDLMGEFSTKLPVEVLLVHRNNSAQAATPDKANLRGARFASSSEIPKGRALNEVLIKDLSGGDTITARHLYGNPITFKPTHKLWLFGNHKPRVGGDDEGLWRRLKLVPFRVIIPPERRRPMSEVLADFARERSGILRWAVEGAIEWYADGLPTCQAVDDATAEYRSESDWLAQFLSECCETGATYRETKKALHDAFSQWVLNEYGDRAPGQRWLTTRLLEEGFELGGDGRAYVMGIRLKP